MCHSQGCRTFNSHPYDHSQSPKLPKTGEETCRQARESQQANVPDFVQAPTYQDGIRLNVRAKDILGQARFPQEEIDGKFETIGMLFSRTVLLERFKKIREYPVFSQL